MKRSLIDTWKNLKMQGKKKIYHKFENKVTSSFCYFVTMYLIHFAFIM